MFRSTIYDWMRRRSSYRLRAWFKNRSWFTPLSRVIFGNNVYSRSYYADVERLELGSVEYIADAICLILHPRRVIDVGCGPGHMMKPLKERGVDVYGVDVSTAALERVAQKGLAAEYFDLTAPGKALPGGKYDLAVSCEVAEHLDAQHALCYLQKMTDAAPRVYMTAAEPDMNMGVGLYHVNEQKNEYWIELMRSLNFDLDAPATDAVRRALDRPEVIAYLQRPLIFVRRDAAPAASGPV